ncbi:response regulator transcription factor [Nitrospinota bacterium]
MSGKIEFQAEILVADHDETLRELLEAPLRQAHHNVRLAENGQTALDLIRNEVFDLAIIDQSLPDMSALEILSRLKKSGDEIPHTMVLSSDSTPEAIMECVEAGARDFVVKPFNLSVLIKRIGVILKRMGIDRA